MQPSIRYKTSERNSTIELLRIVAMSVILIYHFFSHASVLYETSAICKYIVLSVLLWGVNVFVMISGYFGIKIRIRNFLNLYVTASLYIALNILICYVIGSRMGVVNVVRQMFIPFTCGGYWYLEAYIGLYFTAPFITPALEKLSLERLRMAVFAFAVFNLLSCGLLGNLCNTNGFTYMQFIFMYITGHWMSREEFSKITVRTFISWAIAIAIIEFGVQCLLHYGLGHLSGYLGRYNNIFVVLQAVCLVGAFSKMKIRSSLINKIATASLGCYLLQDGLFGWKYMYNVLKTNDHIVYYLFAFLLLWVVSYVVISLKRFTLDAMIDKAAAYLSCKTRMLLSSNLR